jgi:hypothetical protein
MSLPDFLGIFLTGSPRGWYTVRRMRRERLGGLGSGGDLVSWWRRWI